MWEHGGAHPSAIGTNLCEFGKERERDRERGGSLSKLEVSWKYHDVSDLAEAAMPRDWHSWNGTEKYYLLIAKFGML